MTVTGFEAQILVNDGIPNRPLRWSAQGRTFHTLDEATYYAEGLYRIGHQSRVIEIRRIAGKVSRLVCHQFTRKES